MPLQKLYLGAQDLLLYLQVYLSDQSSKNGPYRRRLPLAIRTKIYSFNIRL